MIRRKRVFESENDIALSSSRTYHSKEDYKKLDLLQKRIFSVYANDIFNERNKKVLKCIMDMSLYLSDLSVLASSNEPYAMKTYKWNCEKIKDTCDILKSLIDEYLREDNL